tara:strand:+ start:46 stop:501 length:456 start_codon:yes stop_codon:yes gene_type:complete
MKKPLFIITLLILTFQSCKGTPDYMDDQKLCALLVEMTDEDQYYRNQYSESLTKEFRDSILKLQHKVDLKNTELLIEIVNSRGWPNKDSLGCTEFGAPMIIFRHAPDEYFTEVQNLIDKEFSEGRLDGFTHAFIDNHLNGRPGMNFKINEE